MAEKLAVWTLVRNLGYCDEVVRIAIDKINKFIKKETAVKCGKLGFTMVEILTVVGIIAILVAVLIPTLTMVRNMAKETQQRAQLTTIDLALTAFRSGSGYNDYPPSSWQGNPLRTDYSGAQMLAEALLGWDLMGFHPESAWRSDGEDENGTEHVYDLTGTDEENEENLRARRGPYVELATASAFRLNQLFNDPGAVLDADTFVICDVFGIRRISRAAGRIVRAGTPILYYRANTSSRIHDTGAPSQRIYNCIDNLVLTTDIKMTNPEVEHEIRDDGSFESPLFYEYITDATIFDSTGVRWPYRPDSYILISAGADGLYGTSDDICNF